LANSTACSVTETAVRLVPSPTRIRLIMGVLLYAVRIGLYGWEAKS
jgi:hypothetical protein